LKIRPKKPQVIQVITEHAPEYVDLFMDFHVHDGGWLIWPDYLIQIRTNLKLDNYVILYEDEKRIHTAMALFFFDKAEIKKQKEEEANKTIEQQQEELDSFVEDIIDSGSEIAEAIFKDWPPTPEQEKIALEEFKKLDGETQKYQTEKMQYLFLSMISSLHNYFSVMVNGEKMTSLVPKAMQGDDEAFLKAVKVDRNLLSFHPYFIERNNRAQLAGEQEFLRKLSARQSSPNLLGKIRYPGLYMIFAMLEVMTWLNDFTHEEILDLCDACGLDRWQNRIEDVNAVTKQLIRFRRYQKTGGVSMH
jgi:hypothetical protein